MSRFSKIISQSLLFGLFVSVIGFFSDSPPYKNLLDDEAIIKISLRHSGALLGKCRQRTAEELANLQPTMRIAQTCPRERSPVLLQLWVDGEKVVDETLLGRGLHRDGTASFYRRLRVASGEHDLVIKMNDDQSEKGYPYQLEKSLVLKQGEVRVIDFDSNLGSFIMD